MKKTLKALGIVLGVTLLILWACWILVWGISAGQICRDCSIWVHIISGLSIIAWFTYMVRSEIK